MSSTSKQYLFSYGTLLPGRVPAEIAPIVRKFRIIGEGEVRGQLYDLGEYPGAILNKNGQVISGKVLEIPQDPHILQQLDEYEGFDPVHPQASLFVRRQLLIEVKHGEKLKCWIYVYNRHPGNAPNIAGGDFLKARNHRSR